jgi:hypothetical protein
MSMFHMQMKNAGQLNLDDNIIIDDALYDEDEGIEDKVVEDNINHHFTLVDKLIFRRPARHKYAFKWVNNPNNAIVQGQIRSLFKMSVKIDIICSILSFITLILLIIDNEIIFLGNIGLNRECDLHVTTINNILRTFTIVLTMLIVGMIIYRNKIEFKWSKISLYEKGKTSFIKSRYFK